MTPKEIKATFGLGSVFILRMLGMLMVLPILTSYGKDLKDANDFLLGLAIGMYGITQALLQIPMGLMSDRFGRKKIIINGLWIFIIGSIIAASTNSIWGVIIGRTLQGSGAISSTIIALLTDLIHEKNRTKAIAFLGISFGITFAISIIIGPIITHIIGLHGLFWIISLLGMAAILIIKFYVPDPPYNILNNDINFIKKTIKNIIKNLELLKLNYGIFCLHSLLIINFIAVPLIMIDAGIPTYQHWQIYLSTLLIAFISIIPFIIYANNESRTKKIFLLCIIILFISELIFYFCNQKFLLILTGLQLFFIAFNVLETLLPALVTKTIDKKYKGTAMSIYSTSQFLGVASGGILGGFLLQLNNGNYIFIAGIVFCAFWFLINFKMHISIKM
ncbi:MAG: MFS transporter [Arsenophonus sp.]|nr:MAG: MFS transporter [Arsenophonus sp.]